MAKNVKKMYINEMGQPIPAKYISDYDKLRDEIVERIYERYTKARKMLETTLQDTLADLEKLQDKSEVKITDKGNITFRSFDGNTRVELRAGAHIELDSRVIAARDKMLAYAKELCLKAGDDAEALFELVSEAFQTNKSGSLSASKVLALCRRNITAKVWQEARKELLDSINPVLGKTYIKVGKRLSRQQDYSQILLDINDCW